MVRVEGWLDADGVAELAWRRWSERVSLQSSGLRSADETALASLRGL